MLRSTLFSCIMLLHVLECLASTKASGKPSTSGKAGRSVSSQQILMDNSKKEILLILGRFKNEDPSEIREIRLVSENTYWIEINSVIRGCYAQKVFVELAAAKVSTEKREYKCK